MVLKNIFLGATDDLKIGYREDVKELRYMANKYFNFKTKSVIVGPSWRIRISNIQASLTFKIYNRLCLLFIDTSPVDYPMKSRNVYLDGAPGKIVLHNYFYENYPENK